MKCRKPRKRVPCLCCFFASPEESFCLDYDEFRIIEALDWESEVVVPTRAEQKESRRILLSMPCPPCSSRCAVVLRDATKQNRARCSDDAKGRIRE